MATEGAEDSDTYFRFIVDKLNMSTILYRMQKTNLSRLVRAKASIEQLHLRKQLDNCESIDRKSFIALGSKTSLIIIIIIISKLLN